MRLRGTFLFFVTLQISLTAGGAFGQTGQLTVKVDQPGVKISPMLHGLMTEEINFSYDGGLYGELIRNRIFKDSTTEPVRWKVINSDGANGTIELDTNDPVNTKALTTSLRLDIANVDAGQRVGVANEGYWGIPVKPNTTYRASFYAKGSDDFKGPLTVDIESNEGTVAAKATVPEITNAWKKYEVKLTTGHVAESASTRFVISAGSKGSVWFNLVSLFPPTFNDRPNGNRIDIMNLLKEMNPKFLRFPGGNYLEGSNFQNRFNWKTTIGPLEERPGHNSPWRYRSTDGMGLLEFLNWCEDLKMEPLLAVFAGFTLNGTYVATGDQLKPLVQDALDEIEYVTGDVSTTWGTRRAKDGHPEPFKLQYVEVGNEDNLGGGGRTYEERFAAFYDGIKAKYPNLKVISTYRVKNRDADVVDDHFYRSARQMERDTHHYDVGKPPRSGPKVFVGEWATREGSPTPNMNAALGDASWMIGMERNSDLVLMHAYAPLFVNVNPGGMQWMTDLIGYNTLTSYGSPAYYAQVMFSQNLGNTVLPVELTPPTSAVADVIEPHGGIGLATWDTVSEYKDIKVTNGDKVLYESDFTAGTTGWRPTRGSSWQVFDGAYRQTASGTDRRASYGAPDWTDYTLTLKARKISGNEGFMIMVHGVDNDNYVWWNIGGWGNTQTALEVTQDGERVRLGEQVPVKIETDRWYDIRIEIKGRDIKCYLDDKLVSQGTQSALPPPPLVFATASRVDNSGRVIVKFVNAQATPATMDVHLQGVEKVTSGTADVLSGNPTDVNSPTEPTKVAPKTSPLPNSAASFTHEFPAHSITVMRLETK